MVLLVLEIAIVIELGLLRGKLHYYTSLSLARDI
jgi:hypothetical protein